jgi:hypothetical protein
MISVKVTYLNEGFVTNIFEPTRLSQVSHAERPVVEKVEIVPVLVMNLQGELVESVSPTLTMRPMPKFGYLSLSDNNTVLTKVPGVRDIVKRQSGFSIVEN